MNSYYGVGVCVLQERAGVKMMMIQDGPMPTGADKPLRISGDPYKVQVRNELTLPRDPQWCVYLRPRRALSEKPIRPSPRLNQNI